MEFHYYGLVKSPCYIGDNIAQLIQLIIFMP